MTPHSRAGLDRQIPDANSTAVQAQAKFQEGLALHHKGQLAQAQEIYRQVLTLQPRHFEALYMLGMLAGQTGHSAQAIEWIDQAIKINPGYASAYSNRGNALKDLGQYQVAIDSYNQAIALKPDHVDAYYNRGVALYELKQQQAAIDSYNKAIALKPDHVNAYYNRSIALYELKQHQAAIDSFDKTILIKPDSDFLHGMRLHTKMCICDWRDAKNQFAELALKIQRREKASPPFPILALSASLPLQRRAAEIWNASQHPGFSSGSIPKRPKGEKIRLGYFSMDFRNHAVSVLMAELFETHDRQRFEVFAFSFGPGAKDEMRTRLEAAFDEFIDVCEQSDKKIAELSRHMEIDIAIDLAGFTAGSRPGIFALRAAPLQVNYLGYPGTMGVDYIDYLIADKTLIPEAGLQHYAEKIAYLPSFQANDSQRQISDKVFTREELGLPQSGFVFCCFNSNYKITPGTFDGWMRILQQVGESVLFLYAENELAATNLRREACQRGVDANRLVFGKRLSAPDYLARYRAADLFLDTLPFNAGTTASDALWAGLPVLTCTGEAFASRMAASLLHAIDLPELITATQEDYEALAVQLATHPEQLKAIGQKLERNRLSTALFDTKLFTRNIEEAYIQMYQRYQADLPPEHIYVGSAGEN